MRKSGIAIFLLFTLFIGRLNGYAYDPASHLEGYEQSISQTGIDNIVYFQPTFEFSSGQVININPVSEVEISANHWLLTSSFDNKLLNNEEPPSFWQECLFFLLFPYHTFL